MLGRAIKLTLVDVEAIRKRLSTGESTVQIAKDFPVTRQMIRCIQRGLVWRSDIIVGHGGNRKPLIARKCEACDVVFESRLPLHYRRFCSNKCKDRQLDAMKYRDLDVATRRANNLKSDLFHHYGLRQKDFDRLVEKQDGLCAICEKAETVAKRWRLSVDHDHDTGLIRGLLCSRCNVGIGMFGHDTTTLAKAILYLQNNAGEIVAPRKKRA